jgi:P27 family predicted phage terminase small subunit
MKISDSYPDFLTADGRAIFDEIHEHLKRNGLAQQADFFELAMLANSFDMYRKAAKDCNDKGYETAPSKTGYTSVNPSFTVMKTEYSNVLKHSAKFGLNAGDRARLFKGKLDKVKKKQPNEDLD